MNQQFPWRRWYYHIKHRYFTLNNIVLAAACVIAFGLVWNSMIIMQRNYTLQRDLDMKKRQKILTELEVQNLKYQKSYHQSTEYKELAARTSLDLALPGEKVLILPPNSAKATQDTPKSQAVATENIKQTNFEQWLDFLSGQNIRDLQSDE